MAETIIVEEEMVEERLKLTELAQKVLHLGLGAAALVQDEVKTLAEKAQNRVNNMVEQTQQNTSELVEKMVERGSDVEEDGRQRVNVAVKDGKKQVNKVQGTLEDQIEKVMRRMNVLTTTDIEKLEKKISTLAKKIDALG